MSTAAKIHLSKLETELIKNKEWILTKQAVIEKVYQLFGELNEIFKQISEQEKAFLPDARDSYAGNKACHHHAAT